MIIFSEHAVPDLMTYGILIPVQAERKRQIYKMLTTHPVLAARQRDWHVKWEPRPIERKQLERAHTKEFVDGLLGDHPEPYILDAFELVDAQGRYHRYDPSLAKKPIGLLRDDILGQASGTIRACEVALQHNFAYYLGGGMHHAMPQRGAGFCLINDVVIAIRELQAQGKIKTAWVIDVDAHKGDGTAEIVKNDPSILTLSIHMAHGWPLDANPTLADGTANPSFTASTVDVPVESHQARDYNHLLEQGLKELQKKSPFKPDLAIVVNGSDPFEEDVLASTAFLKLNLEELLIRDKMVYEFLERESIPQAYVLAGGYGPNVWKVHAQFIEWALLKRN